ncbi:uncharacterized protein LOC127527292 [Erpetoichthys calabaricus]|uniref:uncharacterized protein LOC127527292 n=1 Tax=Erpetoichthys calabaricus TaxID=27687 RepID=UPI002234D16A|nr:uncharacterized protein LOC127527292 [Erpetoichthys calabaricus]
MTYGCQNMHRDIESHFGKDGLKLVREYEQTARKMADYRNHLRFSLRCRQSGITPKSLQMKSSVKGLRANKILQKAQSQLLNERVRQTNFTIDVLKSKEEQIHQRLSSLLDEKTLQQVLEFTEKARLAQHEKSKTRQKRKFDLLAVRHKHQHTMGSVLHNQQREGCQTETKDVDKWVKNLSDKQLTQAEKNGLSKGLNFAVTPKQIPLVELITATESAIRNNNIADLEAEQLRIKVSACLSNAKPPASNISIEERKALTALSKDNNIIILPADKGRCTVVLNQTDYHEKILSLLSDKNTYEPLKRDPGSGYKKKVIDCLKQLVQDNAIDQTTYHRLYPGESTPSLYGLPKIHKQGAPLRPIVCMINSVTYNISKFLAAVLNPVVGSPKHHIQNTLDFVEKVREVIMEAEETLVSFDVTSLFTCVPVTEAVEVVRKRLQNDPTLSKRTSLNADQVCLLLELCLQSTYFIYKSQYYRQKHGCAMGSPVSPIVANLHMEEVEKRALSSYPGTPPSHWFRYVDDTWVKIRSQEVPQFTDHINGVDKHIKFTREDMKNNKLAFLDCEISIVNGGHLKVDVYRKPTHTDQYLRFDSLHPLEHKLGVIRTLQHRANTIPTDSEAREAEEHHVKKALNKCGYPSWSFVKAGRTPTERSKRFMREEGHPLPKRKPLLIPYVSGVSEQLRRIFSKHQVSVAFKLQNTLRQRLVHPKDRVPRHKQSNIVYAVKCQEECRDLYIGETKQPLAKRMSQHRRASSSGQDSAVYLHLQDSGHSLKDEEVHILDREERWFERGIKEAIYVKKERPSLNRGGGLRVHLSPSYNAVQGFLPEAPTPRNENSVKY